MSGSAVVLCILDGWGNGDGSECDAIHAAHKPFWESVASRCPRSSLSASGEDVGLPATQVGNSEVGHISLGAGRVVPQDLQRINAEIGGIHSNPYLLQFVDALRNGSGVCHIMGLLSDGGVHGLQDHITKLVQVFAELRVQVMIHAFLDGRDVPPRSAKKYVTALGEVVHSCGASIATVSGRYYAMDRDNRLDRTEKAYEAIALARGPRYRDAITAVESNYSDGISDEFLVPSVIGDYQGFSPGDGILLTNFRSDRIVQILSMILHRSQEVSNVLGMVRYSEKIQVPSLFPPRNIYNTLGEVVSGCGLRQLRIAETEKYAHVTFFFSGGREEPFPGEDRVIIPSPQVSTYDLQPEMSAFPMTEVLVKHIESKQYSLVVVNYANADMVGHTGNLEAVKKAISVVDTCLQMVFDATRKAGATMLITADHGNAEKMFDTRGTPFTAHTSNTVPLVLCNCDKRFGLIDGRLCDVAPTILELMKIAKPDEMTGSSLLTLA
ncbi:phosphoglycerate mutase (2,3-diphosphoglycerate-independent) [Anaplasma ovis str. Haibei]|uniref:2,3-bisphosphoglycerate-independent phosphoglycerate mutase n=1 Tax=Anaplasma ovis str. Haibei TaxID=1248439 RepID=A0A2Z2L8A8_9RICK|nr:2,3-bisphosphoglycerate-independent phosphoglycerate mutase [Anaplasma ovis]ASI47769.1 phosphoglycerate mutase (2,3-diphosphoglycerate-independent) [Anaplasma ovis str. Haibei]